MQISFYFAALRGMNLAHSTQSFRFAKAPPCIWSLAWDLAEETTQCKRPPHHAASPEADQYLCAWALAQSHTCSVLVQQPLLEIIQNGEYWLPTKNEKTSIVEGKGRNGKGKERNGKGN